MTRALPLLDQLRLDGCAPEHREALRRYLEGKGTQVAAGHRARDAGFALETWLEAQHKLALQCGLIARMAHVGPPSAHVRIQGVLTLKATGPGPADYQGQLVNGRSVAVEAKSRTERLRREDVTLYQQADLGACADHGGLALLVYEHRDGLRVQRYAIPWREVPWRATRKGVAETVGPEDCASWAVGEGIYLEPWL